MRINSVNNQIMFQSYRNANQVSYKQHTKPDNDNEKIAFALAGLGVLGLVGFSMTKGKVVALEEALAKQGVELKNGKAVIKETGEKFTGIVKRNVKTLGLKQETVRYENGIMTEQLYHNALGQELNANFYKNGKLYYEIGVQGNVYNMVIHSEEKGIGYGRGKVEKGKKVFDVIREFIKNEKK